MNDKDKTDLTSLLSKYGIEYAFLRTVTDEEIEIYPGWKVVAD